MVVRFMSWRAAPELPSPFPGRAPDGIAVEVDAVDRAGLDNIADIEERPRRRRLAASRIRVANCFDFSAAAEEHLPEPVDFEHRRGRSRAEPPAARRHARPRCAG